MRATVFLIYLLSQDGNAGEVDRRACQGLPSGRGELLEEQGQEPKDGGGVD